MYPEARDPQRERWDAARGRLDLEGAFLTLFCGDPWNHMGALLLTPLNPCESWNRHLPSQQEARGYPRLFRSGEVIANRHTGSTWHVAQFFFNKRSLLEHKAKCPFACIPSVAASMLIQQSSVVGQRP